MTERGTDAVMEGQKLQFTGGRNFRQIHRSLEAANSPATTVANFPADAVSACL